MKRFYVALVILLAIGLLFPLTDIAKAESLSAPARSPERHGKR